MNRNIKKSLKSTVFRINTHLAGDGSFRGEKSKEFCQLRLNLLIKISYISDFENGKIYAKLTLSEKSL